jgi:hypothetical protein
MENELKYLLYLSCFIWILPPIRQYKTKLFTLFLMISLGYITSLVTYFFIMPNTYLPFITAFYIAALSFIEKKLLKKSWPIFLSIYILMVIIFFFTDKWQYHSIILGINELFIVAILIYKFMLDLLERRFNIFVIVLLTYFFSLVFTIVLINLFDYKIMYRHFYYSEFFEFLLGVFFIIFRTDNDRFIIKL